MNQQQFKDSWSQLKGALKKHWGQLTDEDLALINGDQSRFNAAVRKRYGAKEAEVGEWADRWYAKWTGWYEGYKEAEPAS